MAKFEFFKVVLTPQMAISHLNMTIEVGISQKKKSKYFTPPDHVQILWNDPYILDYKRLCLCVCRSLGL